ncbi:hypothetical protein [Catellatospora sichuanensis]|uniref:hypothetical protein n=1 Tax=Catellatospora sichuanensis TaxID=1969805 RepID=UPI001181E60C|nr:hypothetical protein [Catellatospora sichuanensis]
MIPVNLTTGQFPLSGSGVITVYPTAPSAPAASALNFTDGLGRFSNSTITDTEAAATVMVAAGGPPHTSS